MKNIFVPLLFCSCFVFNSFGQNSSVNFKSSDPALEKAFTRAKTMALSYKGNSDDAVGPWYEAALPDRAAFCMRDVAHQSIGAEILGLSKENKNMLTHFVQNISENKDWCSYWEINKYGKPAPEDYRNDKEFWYNLGSNFDIMYASWRLYLWTGDDGYIKNPEFKNFFEKSATLYIDRWVLDVDALLTRPEFPNASATFNPKDAFQSCRGLPSYSEGIPNLIMGVDLVAAIYRGLMTYSAVLRQNGELKKAELYEQKAAKYQQHIEKVWWNSKASTYNVIYTADGQFKTDPSELFLLWFDAMKDTSRTKKMIEHILVEKANVESSSYLPFLLYKYGFGEKAYDYILYLTDPQTKRREYPEVSYGVIEGIVHGYMGIEPDATKKRIATLYRGKTGISSEIDQLPVLNTIVSVQQESQKTTLHNKGKTPIQWRAQFSGNYKNVSINNKKMLAQHKTAENGSALTYVDVPVPAGQRLNAACE